MSAPGMAPWNVGLSYQEPQKQQSWEGCCSNVLYSCGVWVVKAVRKWTKIGMDFFLSRHPGASSCSRASHRGQKPATKTSCVSLCPGMARHVPVSLRSLYHPHFCLEQVGDKALGVCSKDSGGSCPSTGWVGEGCPYSLTSSCLYTS